MREKAAGLVWCVPEGVGVQRLFWPGLPLSQIPRFLVPSHWRGQVKNKHPPPSPPDQQNTWLLVPTLMLGWNSLFVLTVVFWFIFVLMFGFISFFYHYFLFCVSSEFSVQTSGFDFSSSSVSKTSPDVYYLLFVSLDLFFSPVSRWSFRHRRERRNRPLSEAWAESFMRPLVLFIFFLIFVILLLPCYSFRYIWLT